MQLVSCPDEGKYIRTPPPRFTLHGMHLGIPQAVIFSWGTPAVLYGMHKEPSALERLAMQDTKAISQTCRDQRHLRMYAVSATWKIYVRKHPALLQQSLRALLSAPQNSVRT